MTIRLKKAYETAMLKAMHNAEKYYRNRWPKGRGFLFNANYLKKPIKKLTDFESIEILDGAKPQVRLRLKTYKQPVTISLLRIFQDGSFWTDLCNAHDVKYYERGGAIHYVSKFERCKTDDEKAELLESLSR